MQICRELISIDASDAKCLFSVCEPVFAHLHCLSLRRSSTNGRYSMQQEEYLMADHLDAPGLMSPNSNPKTDITDIYVFQKPGDPDSSILVLNVNPLAPTLANEFESNGLY